MFEVAKLRNYADFTEELDILKIVAENPQISQRKISEQTGMSLGQVNFLMKKCIKKGFIKIEGQTIKSIRYNITPKGMTEKAEKTVAYIRYSCAAVMRLTEVMKEVEVRYIKEGKRLYVYGENDELMQIAKLALNSECFKEKEGNNVVRMAVKDFI